MRSPPPKRNIITQAWRIWSRYNLPDPRCCGRTASTVGVRMCIRSDTTIITSSTHVQHESNGQVEFALRPLPRSGTRCRNSRNRCASRDSLHESLRCQLIRHDDLVGGENVSAARGRRGRAGRPSDPSPRPSSSNLEISPVWPP